MLSDSNDRLAVLIDADNTSATIADALFDEVARLGEASVRRIYGDYANPHVKAWYNEINRHSLIWQQEHANTKGKNASDIAMVIDAMDLLHSGRLAGFVLVSSDSDFTRLAARLREHGVVVYGMGKKNTPESFRNACNRFIYTENLGGGVDDRTAAGTARKKTPQRATQRIIQAVEQLDPPDGWVDLGPLGAQLYKLFPDFDTRDYGYAKLSGLVEDNKKLKTRRTAEGRLQVSIA
ncbi:MAG: NYN domain-containing protein [Pseudomonadota bacterium]